ncbi:MAG: DNA primase [Candidatus Omnitrophica bacterium]|nr:DNA primase [Candidatus Omnitrophota bacterium]
MAGRIPDNVLEDILGRVDIVEVISGYIPLKKAGRNFKAPCPFHHEKTPSFMVSGDRQIYHCFGCGESGNAFKFLMRYERMDFLEAVEAMAKKAGVILPKARAEDHKAESFILELYRVNEIAAVFYADCLNKSPESARAKDYLLKRGINEETVKAFRLGFAPGKWDSLINFLRSKGAPLSLIEKAGLILSKEGGGYYDRFRNRVIFPIFDVKSRVVGFGGRVLDDAQPKYLNSPETPIYTKGKNLYGLSFAKDSIRDDDFVVIVEGQLDFITPYQAGFKNITASQGTALTLEQARLLKRHTHNVVMVYDADDAGQLATLRTLDIFIEEEMNVKVVSLPKGFDPDSFVRKYGVDDFRQMVAQAKGLLDYKLEVLKARYGIKDAESKARVVEGVLETIGKFKNLVLVSEYIKKLAQDLDLREEMLLAELKRTKKDKTAVDYERPAPGPSRMKINPAEKLLIKLMLEETSLIHKMRGELEPADFQDERTSKIVSIMFDLIDQGKAVEPSSLMNDFGQEDIYQVICESVFLPDELSEQNKEKIVNDCVQRLKNDKLKLRRQRLHDQIATAQHSGDQEELRRLTEEFHNLIKQG